MSKNMDRHAVRLLLVDDHRCMILGLARLLDDDPRLNVVGTAGCLSEAEDELVRKMPDVVLLDIELGGGESGFTFGPRARALLPGVRIIVFSTYDGDFYRQHAASIGVNEYVAKGEDIGVLKEAIHKAIAAPEDVAGKDDHMASSLKTLSPGEEQVIQCLALGLSQKEVAAKIGVSPSTVATYVQRAKEKLGARTVIQLISMARLMPAG